MLPVLDLFDLLENLLVVTGELFTAESTYRHLLLRLDWRTVRVDWHTCASSLCLLVLPVDAVFLADGHRGRCLLPK
jgi:hypothetical protein